jgi:hypothetical protein
MEATMSENRSPNGLEQVIAEADELIQQIKSEFITNLEEEHRLQVEQHVQELKRFQTNLQDHLEKKKPDDSGYAPDGINVAIQEIKKAMKALGSYLQ